MPNKRNKENDDPDFMLGKSRKSGFYNCELQDRNFSKQLKSMKGKGY